jgi:hypothetical protein
MCWRDLLQLKTVQLLGGGHREVRGVVQLSTESDQAQGALEDAYERGAKDNNLVAVRMTDAAFDYFSEHGGAPSPDLRVASPGTSLKLTGVLYGVWLAQEQAGLGACIVQGGAVHSRP